MGGVPEFVHRLPRKPSFCQKGLSGYKFGLKNRNVEAYFIDVKQGHDTYIVSKKCTHVYYIVKGKGVFDIGGKKYNVRPGMLVEVPPKIEYSYSGAMKVLLIMNPPWFKGNDRIIKKNPAVK